MTEEPFAVDGDGIAIAGLVQTDMGGSVAGETDEGRWVSSTECSSGAFALGWAVFSHA